MPARVLPPPKVKKSFGPGERLLPVKLTRGVKGFGMVVASNGAGTFVAELVPGGAAEKFFSENDLEIDDGTAKNNNSKKGILHLHHHFAFLLYKHVPGGASVAPHAPPHAV